MAQTDTLVRLEQAQTPEEEILCLRRQLRECQTEFQEFQESSRDLEAELETNIRQLEQRNQDSTRLIERLQNENEQLKSRFSTYSVDFQRQIDELKAKNHDLCSEHDKLINYIRELEQSNDDLERAQRELSASLKDFESQLDQQIERNVLLENEVSEKEEMKGIIQRLKDEARDLRLELTVNEAVPAKSAEKRLQSTTQTMQPTDATTSDMQSAKAVIPTTQRANNPASPTDLVSPTRMSALNIVNELLRKVGALEAKLTKCKKLPGSTSTLQ